jgi:hypothetical protein
MDQAADFFVSYTSADRVWAEWIAWQLEQAGYQVIVQAWDFEPGDNFVARMRDALQQADRTLALVSAAYLASPYCIDEWTGRSCTIPTAATVCCRSGSGTASCPGCCAPRATSTLSACPASRRGRGCWPG